MTATQAIEQCDGPWRPSAGVLAAIVDSIPRHNEIRAISINGQSGIISVETYHEELEQTITFNLRTAAQNQG